MWDALWFWFAKFLVELGLGLLLVSPLLVMLFWRWLKQKLCKHHKFFETGACKAICVSCRKDLGFIGRVIKERKEKEE